MEECFFDAILDTLKLLPYLFVTFLILEAIEHKLSKKSQKVIGKYKKIGPLIGGVMGGFPQCGFSVMGANLYTCRVITMGTLVAIFLSTSDEMLPIMLGEGSMELGTILSIVGSKILIGVVVGVVVDLIFRRKVREDETIKEVCEDEHCHCDKEGVWLASLKHTLKTAAFVLAANILINLLVFWIGTEQIATFLENKNIFVYFVASLVGLVPNCAASVILTELLMANVISVGVAMAGLLTGSGLGILILFKTNKSKKENFIILGIIYLVGVLAGIITDLIL